MVVRESMRVHLYRCSPPPDIVAAAVSRNRDCAGSLLLAAGPIKCHGQRKLHGCSRGLCTDKRGKSRRAPVGFCGPTKRDPCEQRWKMTIPVLTRGDRRALMDALESPSPGGAAGVCRAGPALDRRRRSRLPEPVSLHDWQSVTRARTAERETDLLSAGAGAYGEDGPLAARLDGPLRRSLRRCRKWVSAARDSGAG